MNSRSLHSLLILCSLCPLWLSSASAQKEAKAPAGGVKHIYKTVGDLKLPLYLYAPIARKSTGQAPAIVFFFGGGWKNGSPAQFEEHCKFLAKRGMVAITVEYRVSSRHNVKVEDCIADARSAMRWVRGNAKKLGVDPNRIASGGGSAGGHLAAAVALMDSFDSKTDDLKVSAQPNAMVLFNPAMAIAPHKDLPAACNEQFKTRLSDRSRGPVEKVSPFQYATRKQPPCIMFFGTADALLVGAEAYRKASVAAGNKCEIITYKGQGHGFFNAHRSAGNYLQLTMAEMDNFLISLGWLKPRDGGG